MKILYGTMKVLMIFLLLDFGLLNTLCHGIPIITIALLVYIHSAIERLERARIEAKRPGPEKAAAKQELHKKLRVSNDLVVLVYTYK